MKKKNVIKNILMIAALGIAIMFFTNVIFAANTATISVETANLRETADEESRILVQLSLNDEVEVLQKTGNWYEVKTENNVTGYLREDLVEVSGEVEEAQNTSEETNTIESNTEATANEEQETTEIDTIIQDIVLQDQKCNEAYRLMLKKISEQKQQIAKLIVDFLQIVENREELYERCKEIGDKEAIEVELTKLNDQLEQLSKEYNVTEIEIDEYQSSIESARALRESFSVATKEIEQMQGIQSVVDIKLSPKNVFTVFNELFDNAIDEVKKIADEAWGVKQEEILQVAHKKCGDIELAISKYEERIAILKPKMDGNEQISKLSASIVKERERLAKLSEYQTQISMVQAQYKKNLNELSQSFYAFSQIYLAYVDSINSGFVSSTDELEFSVRKVLRIDQLMQKISDLLDNRSIGRFHAFNLREITEDVLSSEHIEAFIEAILTNSKDTLQLKGGFTVESALRELLSDWYNVDYVV